MIYCSLDYNHYSFMCLATRPAAAAHRNVKLSKALHVEHYLLSMSQQRASRRISRDLLDVRPRPTGARGDRYRSTRALEPSGAALALDNQSMFITWLLPTTTLPPSITRYIWFVYCVTGCIRLFPFDVSLSNAILFPSL